jgi:phosphoglycolate phosphatase-like HAD superfamily hydrolase
MNKLILFDIDGTLTASAIGHIEAHAVAYQKVFGIYGSIFMIDFDGKTDRRITKEVLASLGVAEAEIEAKLPMHLQVMGEYYDSLKPYLKPKLLPGVAELLYRLHNDNNVLLGNVTGNLERIAKDKLEVAGIAEYFDFGGFGSESDERPELVRLAIERARDRGFEGDDVYVIGDTPVDITAGNAAGAKTVGVATGSYSQKDLQEAGATITLPSLDNLRIAIRELDL